MPVKIFLVRHAHAAWSPAENRPLSEKGFRDAQQLAEKLSAYPIQAVYASPSLRALQTVQPLAQHLGLEIKIEPRFRERVLGDFTGVSFEAAVRQTWLDFNFSFLGGESNAAAQSRAIQGLEALVALEKASPVVVSTHGNLLALIMNYYDPTIGYDFWSQLAMPDVVELEVSP